ncbi:MAG: peptidylprolyl isomerase [Novosphingobium sp.]|nr:peptidylprolyl isomerase [Novosphingobium sp.]MCP5404259.1 peptidylprolyl isomerase [Novosphingobium sp.]
MTARFARLAAALWLFLSAALAHAEEPPQPAPAPELVRVAMTTQLGTITLDLDAGRAPVTTANFLRYVDEKRFDGIVFYRVMRLEWGEQPNGLIQAGVQGNPQRVLPPIAHEPTSETGILHKAGAISMARFAPGTATGDFSILVSDIPGLDANPDAPDPDSVAGFAAFGHVVEGMEVVRNIYDVPLSPTKGEGFLKGQMIENPVKILTVRRVKLAPPAPTESED